MTRLFLAAGVAALAISAPAAARPGGDHGNTNKVERQRAAPQRAQAQERRAAQRQSARVERPQRMERQQRFAAVERQRPQRMERQQRFAAAERQRPQQVERHQVRTERAAQRPAHTERAQARVAEHQQVRANRVKAENRMAERQQVHANRVQAQNRMAERQHSRVDRQTRSQDMMAQRQQLRADRQMRGQDLREARNVLRADRIANADAFRTSRFAKLTSLTPRTRVIEPIQAVRFVGQPLSAVTPLMTLSPLPVGVSYLYPDTPDYYYRYGDGYLYQVDRDTSLISALLPLLAGGFMPGSYLPNYYMNSYVPSYYGLNSFYPSTYSAFDYGYGGYGYDNLCNRYANGVIYRVDCLSGMIVDVVPMYAGGYGVGQMLPSAYSYYNVPAQYRTLYYDTPDYNYWYAPGAIYQYDRGSSMITSVAALLSPGFTVGQPLPMGYSTYNVPYAYRSTYYDTPNAWYRYNNGYIYQVDPTTQLVSAIVASILT